MDYMFLIYADEERQARRTPEDRMHCVNASWAIMDELRAQGKLKGASPLESTAKAFTFRGDGAKVTVTDGPFAETREVLAGYYLIDCTGPEEARRWGTRMAQVSCGGIVEVRPLAAIPARVEPVATHA